MEHNEAVSQHATERYLLNEMSAAERDAFEDHYFECVPCAEDVRDGARMIAAGREVAREGAAVLPMPKRRGWSGWVPQAVAASVVGGALGWFGAVQTVAPRVATTNAPVTQPRAAVVDGKVYLETGQERGPEGAAVKIGTDENMDMELFIAPPDAAATKYVISLRNNAGNTLASVDVSREQAAEPVTLNFGELPAGEYRVVIESVREGGNRFPVTTASFDVVEQRAGSPTRRQP